MGEMCISEPDDTAAAIVNGSHEYTRYAEPSPLRRALLRHLELYSGVTEPRPCDEIAAIACAQRDDI
jgi:hypothetical protein